MWGDRTDRLLLAGLLAASLVLFFRYWDYGINDDEGYLVGGVTRILDGQVPYRDFHHTYGPGRFYLVAFLFRLFGENLLVVRALWVVLRVLIVGLAFVAGRRFLSKSAAVAAALFFLAAPGPWHKSFFHLFLLANFLFLARLGRGTGRDAAAAGFIAGGTFLFRQDLGIFAFLVYALLLLLRRWSDESPRRGAAFFLSALAAVLPFLLYFAFEGALGDAARKVLFAGAGDNRTNALPFPPVFLAPSGGGVGLAFAALRALYYLPVPLFLVAGAWGAARFFCRRPRGREILILSLFGLLAFNQSLWRSDLAHLFQSLAPFYLLLPWLFERVAGRMGGALLSGAALLSLFLSLAAYAAVYDSPGGPERVAAEGLQPIPPYYTGSVVQVRPGAVRLDLERAPVRVPPGDATLFAALGAAIDRYSRPGDYMLTVPGLQLLYFLFDRVNPTAYVHLRRALGSTAEEERYVADLVGKPTKLVILRDAAIDGREERRFRKYARPVFEAIEREFEPVERLGDLIVYRRKEGAS